MNKWRKLISKNKKPQPFGCGFCSVSKNSLSFRGSEATVGIRAFKVAVFLKIKMKSECFGERIATPVCALARNDSFFDSLKKPQPFGCGFCFRSGRRGSNSPPASHEWLCAIRRSPAEPLIECACGARWRQRVRSDHTHFQKQKTTALRLWFLFLERATRLELATSTLARWRSTR